MTDDKRQRGELPPDRLDEAADPQPREPRPNLHQRDDGRGRDERRTGSDSNPD